jgi:hypothetical protein
MKTLEHKKRLEAQTPAPFNLETIDIRFLARALYCIIHEQGLMAKQA